MPLAPRLLAAVVVAMLASPAAWAEQVVAGACEPGWSAATAADRALLAYIDRDLPSFTAEATAIEAALPCVTTVLDPVTASRLHLVFALARLGVRDREGAVAELRALPAGFSPPLGLAPEGQFLHGLFAEVAAMPPRARLPAPVATGEVLVVDGVPSTDRPEGAAILQVLGSDGGVRWTGRQWPPVLVVLPVEPLVSASPPPPRPVAPVVATAAATALGLAGLGLGLANRSAFDDLDTPYENVAGLQSRSTLYTGLAITGAAATVACGAWWVVTW